MNDKLNRILEAMGEGNDLALGELPAALACSRAADIVLFSERASPILGLWRDEPRKHVSELLINAHEKAVRLERMEHLLPEGFIEPVRPKGAEDGLGILSGLEHHIQMLNAMRRSLVHTRKLGLHKGENSVARHPDNDPVSCAAKGLKPFTIEGVEVWAGTEKAAWKKWKLMMATRA
jgi:hypothetical protein